MADIIKEILDRIDKDLISDAAFEGANIVLYTKDKDFFKDNEGVIKKIVDEFKKRVELRPDPSLSMELEKAEKAIKELIPEEAAISQILFEPPRSIVTIEVEKPGVAIGKQGSILRDIRDKTCWVPIIRRAPPIKSNLIDNIRSVLYQNADDHKKFLNKTGHRVYDGWIRGKKNEWIRITYLGSGRQVGRSCILLQTPESRVLLDCGIDVANEREPFPYLECPEFNINELDAVIVSHAHLDHSGLIPLLFKYGYKGPVYCTAPTRDVMSLLQLDYIKIMKNEGKDPIYTSDEVKQTVMNTICLDYEEVTDVTPDVRITLYNSGHILGGALVHLHIGNGLHNIVYTGDLKCIRTHLLEPAATKFPRVETLMIEATYGGKANVTTSRKECEEEVMKIIQDTVKKGGKILMPVLGSGRAQEILLILEEMIRTGKLEKLPVYIDGMVWDVTAIHTAYPGFLNNAVRKQIFHKDNNPFLSEIFKRVGSQKERMQIVEEEDSCIVLATSGMLTGGPSVEYLKHFAENKNNALIFTCYLGEGSLGKRIQQGMTEWEQPLSGGKVDVTTINMNIVTIDGFTGHADRNELLAYVNSCYPKPKKIVINHGESSRCLDLASSLHKLQRVETNAPKNLEAVRIR
jgi:KH/beta-lactamase-domain protein